MTIIVESIIDKGWLKLKNKKYKLIFCSVKAFSNIYDKVIIFIEELEKKIKKIEPNTKIIKFLKLSYIIILFSTSSLMLKKLFI